MDDMLYICYIHKYMYMDNFVINLLVHMHDKGLVSCSELMRIPGIEPTDQV